MITSNFSFWPTGGAHNCPEAGGLWTLGAQDHGSSPWFFPKTSTGFRNVPHFSEACDWSLSWHCPALPHSQGQPFRRVAQLIMVFSDLLKSKSLKYMAHGQTRKHIYVERERDTPTRTNVSHFSWPTKAPCSRRFSTLPSQCHWCGCPVCCDALFPFCCMASVDIKIMLLRPLNFQHTNLVWRNHTFQWFWKLSVGHFCCTYKELAFFCVSILYYEDIWIILLRCFCCGSL